MMIVDERQRPRVSREAEFLQSAREAQERIAQQLKNAGADDETANAGGEIWANHLLARARALGTDEQGRLRSDALTPAELDKLNVRGEEDAGPDWGGDVYDQAVRDGLNMDERVPVVDLSGVADGAKTANVKTLTEHLKTLIKDGPSISRDALAFLNLPKDSYHLGHIAHSGAPIYRKEKSIRNASVLSLPELMKNAVLVESGPNRKKNKKPGVRMYHRFYVPVVTREGIATIRIVAEEKNNSDRLVPLDVRVYDVIINKRIPRTQPIGASASTAEDSFSGITIREMLRGVKGMDGEYYAQSSLSDTGTEQERSAIVNAAKANGTYLKTPYGTETNLTPKQWVLVRTKQFKEWFGDWENDPENASKVLDGNGEPLVVYHGSTHTGFSTFSTAGSMAYPGTGAFFSGRKDVAATYSGSDELVSREPGTSEPALSGEGVYPVFLNLRNPYRIDAEGKDWTNVGEISVYDNETGESVYDRDGEPFRTPREAEEYIERDLDDYSGRYEVSYSAEMTTNEIAQSVGEGNYGDGFDGVIFENVIDEGRWGDVLSADNVYVAFAPNQIKAVDNRGAFSSADANIYNQRQNKLRRGQIQIGSHGEGLVTLFKHADRSTFFHEIGHMMLDDLISDGLLEKANARTKADLETVRKYLGIGDLNLSKRHTFDGAEKARYAEAQERFARSFEAYLMEGKSPTAEMQSVFAKIKQWLIDIYRDIKRLGVELSPEVREVFDRLLATPERGDFGPIFRGYEGEAAIEKLLKERQGEVVGAMSDPRLGENSSIDFVWGTEKYGLAHIEKKHGADALMRIPQIIRKGAPRPLINHRISYETDEGLVVLKNEWKGAEKNWILTSYLPQGTKKDSRSAQDTQTGGRTEESASSSDGNLFSPRISQNPNNSNRDFSVRGDLPRVTVTASPESKSAGALIRVKDIYDKLRAIAPVRKGVSAPANVAGYYTPETDVARERHWGDFPTALHEIGHALDYKLGLRESVRDAETSRQLYDELCELGKATSPQNVNTIYERLHGRYMRASGEEARGTDVSAATLKFEEAQRYIPTHVGLIIAAELTSRDGAVHPHARGVNLLFVVR